MKSHPERGNMMGPRQQVSRAAVDLIKSFEGFRAVAAKAPDGRWTVGYGHTASARQGAVVSESDAEALLLYDLILVAHAVNESLYTRLNGDQFDALCAFAFNIGIENFRRSAVLKRVNEGHLLQAALEMELWRKADFEGERIVIDALVRRRAAEKALFLTPVDGWIAVPTSVLPPKLDQDQSGLVPRQVPRVVVTSLEGQTIRLQAEPVIVSDVMPPETVSAGASPETTQPAVVPSEPDQTPVTTAWVTQPQPADIAKTVQATEPPPAQDPPAAAPLTVFERPPPALPESAPEPLPGLPVESPVDMTSLPERAQPVAAMLEPEIKVYRGFITAEEATPPPPTSAAPFERHAGASWSLAPVDTHVTYADQAEVAHSEPYEDPEPEPHVKPTLGRGLVPLAGLAVVSLILMGAGLTLGFGVRGSNGALLAFTAGGILLGIVGVIGFGLTVYTLLARLGVPPSEDEDLG